MRFRVLAVGLTVLAAVVVVRAQQDADGSADHPTVSRFPGYDIASYDAQDFSTYDVARSDGARTGGPVAAVAKCTR